MNEITAPFSGVIEKINVKNGDVLGFNQTIMVIRPQD
jgi:biotin carboxyl carrier protein